VYVGATVSSSHGTQPVAQQSHHLPGRTRPTTQHTSAKAESSLPCSEAGHGAAQHARLMGKLREHNLADQGL